MLDTLINGDSTKKQIAIAKRIFSGAKGRKVTISLYKPTRVGLSEWKCRFDVDGLELEKPYDTRGVDSFQALMLSIQRIEMLLDSPQVKLRWKYGEKGDLGIYRHITPCLGLEFQNRMKRYMASEETKYVNKLKRKAERATRKARGKR